MRWSGSGCVCWVAVLGLELGCGRSIRTTQGSSSGTGGAGASSMTGSTGEPGGRASAGRGATGGAAGGPGLVTSCTLFMGMIVNPPMGASLGGVDLGQKYEEGCEWRLGEPVALPASHDNRHLVMHYDVNGDQVDDLFFGLEAESAPISSLRLLLSKPYSRDVVFEDGDCRIPLDLEYRSIFARDIDGDQIQDWVVGTPTGIKLLLNERHGLREVGSYDFGETVASAAVMDVAVARFGAGAAQVAVGYDLYRDDVVTGVILFKPTGTGDDLTYESESLSSSALATPRLGPQESGYVTTVELGGTPAIVVLGWGVPDTLGWLWDGAGLRSTGTSLGVEGYVNFASPLVAASSAALAVGFPESVRIFGASDDLTSPLVQLDSVPTVFAVDGLGREPGGGTRRSSRLLRDLDRDGNDDLIELGSYDPAASESFVVSLQRPGGWRRTGPIPLHGYLGSASIEDPFLHVATLPARVLIREAGEIDDGPDAPALQSLKCELP